MDKNKILLGAVISFGLLSPLLHIGEKNYSNQKNGSMKYNDGIIEKAPNQTTIGLGKNDNGRKEGERPNIVYIMADDITAQAMSIYGKRLSSVFQTPNVDRIGREGCMMTGTFCTNAICVPSRATIMTGQYSHVNGVKTLRDTLDVKSNTFIRMMHDSGYQTAIFGKWHLGTEPQGFDYYDVTVGNGSTYFNPKFIEKGSVQWNSNKYPQGKAHQGHITDIISDKALSWMRRRDKEKPFILMVHHKAAHGPIQDYQPRYASFLQDVEIPEPVSLFEDYSHRSEATRLLGKPMTGKFGPLSPDEIETTKQLYQSVAKDYLRHVKGFDESVGLILDYIDKEGLTENTVVIITSDQGIFLGEHSYRDKRWVFEDALQMPFLIRYPGEIPANTVCDDIVSNVDFAPTILDYAGLEKTDEMQGRSFRDNVRGYTPSDWKHVIYYRYWMHLNANRAPAHFAIRTKDYKLIFFYGLPLDAQGAEKEITPAGWELYDLKNDPDELKNVYNDPAYAEIVKQLKTQLFELKAQVKDNDDKYPELQKRLKETK